MYSILHQPRKDVLEQSYIQTMAELHQAIWAESLATTARWGIDQQELLQRSVETARGSLTQFLTTPLQGDFAEIYRILADGFLRLAGSNPNSQGVFESSEGRIDGTVQSQNHLKGLLGQGRKLLRSLGFSAGANSAKIFESIFLIKGSGQLDVIERIVRDTLGIYAPTHGKHIQEVETNLFSLHNLVHQTGGVLQVNTGLEFVLMFEKDRSKYSQFRKELVDLIERLHAAVAPQTISLWQRKLGLGVIPEFVLRGKVLHLQSVEEIISLIRLQPRSSMAKERILKGGLFLRENLPFENL